MRQVGEWGKRLWGAGREASISEKQGRARRAYLGSGSEASIGGKRKSKTYGSGRRVARSVNGELAVLVVVFWGLFCLVANIFFGIGASMVFAVRDNYYPRQLFGLMET